MELNAFEMKTENKEIYEFYKEYNLDFENMNLIFINILKKLIVNLDTSLNNNIASNLLNQIKTIDLKINTINTSLIKSQEDLSSTFSLKLNAYQKDYIENLNLIISQNNLSLRENFIKEANENLVNKTSTIITELLPKNQETINREITSCLSNFKSSLLTDTTILMSNTLNKETFENTFKSINDTFGKSHITFSELIQSTERKMNDFKETLLLNNLSQKTLQDNVSEILKKFENGSSKGNISEHITYNILLSLFPCAQIDHVGNEHKESGDIILIRNNKPKILIENKDHESKNVLKHEVDKFIRDCEIQNCCGIMFAQHRGICNKENFEIQIHNKNVLLYVHEVHFDKNTIKTAVEIVEHFKERLDEITFNNNEFTIETETLEEINKDFIMYINQKHNMIKLLKDFDEKMAHSINELKMPNLEKYLSSKFAYSFNQNSNLCKFCNKFVLKSMPQHLRHCPEAVEFEHLKKEGENKTENHKIGGTLILTDDDSSAKKEISTTKKLKQSKISKPSK